MSSYNGKSHKNRPSPIKLLFLGRLIFNQPLCPNMFLSLKNQLSPFPLYSSLLIKPASISSFSYHLSIHPSLIFVSSRSLVGAERWQACVCRARLSAFLMRLKHWGSAYYGDEQIQAGQKVMDLANRGPLSVTPPNPPTSHVIFLLSIYFWVFHSVLQHQMKGPVC